MNHRSLVWQVSLEEFTEIINTSNTMSEVLRRFNLESKGNNHLTVKERAKKEGISLDGLRERYIQFQRENAIKRSNKTSLELILVENRIYNGSKLRKRLVEASYIEDKCSNCGIDAIWDGKPLSLQLDHINGIHSDNRLENLRLLCPNCHSQTENFSGKSKKKAD